MRYTGRQFVNSTVFASSPSIVPRTTAPSIQASGTIGRIAPKYSCFRKWFSSVFRWINVYPNSYALRKDPRYRALPIRGGVTPWKKPLQYNIGYVTLHVMSRHIKLSTVLQVWFITLHGSIYTLLNKMYIKNALKFAPDAIFLHDTLHDLNTVHLHIFGL